MSNFGRIRLRLFLPYSFAFFDCGKVRQFDKMMADNGPEYVPSGAKVRLAQPTTSTKKQSNDCFFLYIQKINLPGEADVDDGLAQLGDVLGAATVDADVALSVVEGGVEADVTATRDRVVFHTAAGEP